MCAKHEQLTRGFVLACEHVNMLYVSMSMTKSKGDRQGVEMRIIKRILKFRGIRHAAESGSTTAAKLPLPCLSHTHTHTLTAICFNQFQILIMQSICRLQVCYMKCE